MCPSFHSSIQEFSRTHVSGTGRYRDKYITPVGTHKGFLGGLSIKLLKYQNLARQSGW